MSAEPAPIISRDQRLRAVFAEARFRTVSSSVVASNPSATAAFTPSADLL